MRIRVGIDHISIEAYKIVCTRNKGCTQHSNSLALSRWKKFIENERKVGM